MLTSSLGIRRLASAGVILAPAGVSVHTSSQIVRSSIDDGRGTVDGGVRGSVGRSGLLLVIDGDPSGGLVGALLESWSIVLEIALVTNDIRIGEGHKAHRGQDL